MNAESVRELLRRQPFEPFQVRVTNGDAHLVTHPENAMLAGNRLYVYVPESDRIVIVSLLHIATIAMLQAAQH
jgi:hypothetical protein